ncbi:alcohol dehydrogenase superfamily, zinc-type [Artemisia annua]|uniref:Alcohol dehydrogenase superfamily, zinc-type n=1 Tax=Artemisia annua TaxID=35608 RepID=A0A2U1MR87_ARTAN|nr:alcohol dehydrogenase superfamily, zinc-type [Artemisia annua]
MRLKYKLSYGTKRPHKNSCIIAVKEKPSSRTHYSLLSHHKVNQNFTLLCDVDPMLDDIKVKAKCISILSNDKLLRGCFGCPALRHNATENAYPVTGQNGQFLGSVLISLISARDIDSKLEDNMVRVVFGEGISNHGNYCSSISQCSNASWYLSSEPTVKETNKTQEHSKSVLIVKAVLQPLFPRIPGHEGVGFLSCGCTSGFGAPLKEASVHSGSSVAVFGLGAVGLGGLGIAVVLRVGLQTDRTVSDVGLMLGRTLKGSLFGGIRAHSDMIFLLYYKYSATSCTPIFNAMTHTIPDVITCKAAVVRELGGAITVEEVKVDPPKASEVRIKMLCASICHTDILCCNGYPLPLFPRIPGHEGVGMVESVGKDVSPQVKPGDLVIPLLVGECGQCSNCKSGRTNFCNVYPMGLNGLMFDGTSRMSIAGTGETIYHHFTCSTWSEYMVINVNYVLKVDPKLPYPHASFLSCGFSTGLGAPWKEAPVPNGSSVAVFGLGAVGLGVIKGAQMQGAAKIIGVDVNQKKAAKGKAFGMTDFINPQNHPNKLVSDLIKDMTDGQGVDYSFECTGVAPLLNEALEASKIGLGTTILIGVALETSRTLSDPAIMCGRTLKGSLFGGIKTRSDLPVILQKCINKEIEMDELLTHEIRLENIHEAFKIMKKPDCVKILINF